MVFAGTCSGTVICWDLTEERKMWKLGGHLTEVKFLEPGYCEEDQHLLLTGSGDTNVKLWDIWAKKCYKTFKGHTKAVNCGKLSPDGNWVVTGSDDGDIIIWDIKTESIVQTLGNPGLKVISLVLNPCTYTMASGFSNKSVKYWDLESF